MTNAVQAYSYAGPSMLTEGHLGLSTSGGRTTRGLLEHPRFFSGLITQAAPAAGGLLAVADVALTRYHQPRPGWTRDPVVTCDGDRLRFESFSACGGVYARLDMLAPALDGEVVDRGTTNVDVNLPLREALARVGARDPLHLGVGHDELTVTTLDGAVVEKKVPLPERWLRGFAEVQVIASGFDLRAELAGPHAVRFLRGLPKKANTTVWAVPAGRELRLTSAPAPGAVCLAGPHRLATMLPLLRFARSLRAYGPAVTAGSRTMSGSEVAASAWELELPGMRYTLAISPEAWRGFSGEGAVLSDLATDEAAGDADVIGMLLNFEPIVEVGLLAERSGLPPARVKAALTQLGVAGRVGYDLAEAAHFHRELPYDRDHVRALNPRLVSARDLVESGAVRVSGDTADVTSNGEIRRVRLSDGSCTCAWWFDHRGSRGPCKHVLAARIVGARTTTEEAATDQGALTGPALT
ncbi:SWIM zinc finger family protein [Microtetraspora sp. AC03309]|uniref:SWIM zinc finger family protein n=1 Tax=Microtetraspora sp. AC03309 TaxID=2779376 RepID=UPI001E653503|nr:SWIM zinc finger family protein [Microtetraspora sp. AC03309]MCC5579766.1 SWIM zinc finger family protein [Microtetraspora sp. AC03309]